MARSNMPIIAAVPNYNMAQGLTILLPLLVTQGYDAIYVLDDASTDNSKEVVAQYSDVHWVSSSKNNGSSAARNMILEQINEPSIIHFLDADVTSLGSNLPKKIRAIDFNDGIGFIGGLVLDELGQQNPWNYGPRFSVGNIFVTAFYVLCLSLPSWLSRYMLPLFKHRPTGGTAHQPYWVIESNLIITSETLQKYGAFDPVLREHNIQPLAAAIRTAGLRNLFSNTIVVTKKDIRVRKYNRLYMRIRSEFYIATRYIGWRYLLPF